MLFRSVLAAHLERESGRAWRPLADTSISGQILYGARGDYAALRRGTDFYGEGQLVWLEVDTLIRRLSRGQKSLDDFCRTFLPLLSSTSSDPSFSIMAFATWSFVRDQMSTTLL